MSFDYPFARENRDRFRTSRWSLEGVSTKTAGNLKAGRLWMTAQRAGDTVSVALYKDPLLADGAKVATGTANVSGIDSAAAPCALTAANGSGLSGRFYFESYAADAAGVEVVVSLAADADLEIEAANLSALPAYDATVGMAAYCAAATEKVLLLLARMFPEELGGCAAPPRRFGSPAAVPDFRRLVNPDQLKEAAVHWALMLAFGRSQELADDTAYSARRDYHDRMRRQALAAWRIAFNDDPDSDAAADRARSASTVRPVRN